jgi:hypothetical protein
MKNLIFIWLGSFLLLSCGEKSQKLEQALETPVAEQLTDTPEMVSESESDVETFKLKARFVEFRLGDAEHYKFEDEAGKMWDFSGSVSAEFDFTRELLENEADESNQGWGSNTLLQGKWFMLTYFKNEQAQYIDGPMVWVDIIGEAVLIKP